MFWNSKVVTKDCSSYSLPLWVLDLGSCIYGIYAEKSLILLLNYCILYSCVCIDHIYLHQLFTCTCFAGLQEALLYSHPWAPLL